MDVSIIIVNYNTSHMVLDCVASLYEHTSGVEFEVIVVDNGSAVEDLRNLRNDTRFELIEAGQNIGFGKANNLGAEQANGEYLFLLNPDTLLRNNAITILHRFMKSHPQCGIAGGNLFQSDLSNAHSYHRRFPSILICVDYIYRKTFGVFDRNFQFNCSQTPMEVAAITGADMMIRDSVWDATKGFDSRFFMYFEDVDLCLRTLELNYKVTNVPEAKIIHLEGKSIYESEHRYSRILNGRFIFFHKYHGKLINVIADYINVATLAIGSLFAFFLGQGNRRKNMLMRLKIYIKLMGRK